MKDKLNNQEGKEKYEICELSESTKTSELKELPNYQVTIASEDQPKTAFKYPFGTFTIRRMPFSLCYASRKVQKGTLSIFFDIVENFIEVLLDELFVFGSPVTNCLDNSSKVLSLTLSEAQKNYTRTEKRFLALVFALNKFRSYIVGSRVIVQSDHAALRHLLNKPQEEPRLIKWILMLQEFDIEIKNRKGSESMITDHLSRLIINNE